MHISLFLSLCALVLSVMATVIPTYELVVHDNETSLSTHELVVRGNDDCSDATGKTSQWVRMDHQDDDDGRGKYMGSCGGIGHGKHHCWSDVYLIDSQSLWGGWDWVSGESGSTCNKGQTCTVDKSKSLTHCVTNSESDEVGTELSATISDLVGKLSATHTSTNTDQNCVTDTEGYHCTWTKKHCYRIAASNNFVRSRGYIRRTCNDPWGAISHHRAGKGQDGKYTIGWQDFQIDRPTSTWHHSCTFHCDTDLSKRRHMLPKDGEIIPA